jgi:hypothetical protein
MIRNATAFALVFLAMASGILGCGRTGRQKVETVEVSGTVRLDGQPLEGAKINFLGKEYAGLATTDASGHYALEAQPGENTVYLEKFTGGSPEYDETMVGSVPDVPGGRSAAGAPKQVIPKKYSDPLESELKFTVPEGGSSDANFDLTN